jgi:hypothetical protein
MFNRKRLLSFLVMVSISMLIMPCLADYPVLTEEQIPEYVAGCILTSLTDSSDIVLDVRASEFTLPLENLLKRKLLAENFKLYEEKPEFDHKRIDITYHYVYRVQTEKRFVFSKKIRYIDHEFAYQLTEMPEGKIVSYESISVSVLDENRDSSSLKWYDPVLVTLIAGGLAYLFYFGAN